MHVANRSAGGIRIIEVDMFAFGLGYFHDNLCVVVLMDTFIVRCGDFRWLFL